MIAFKDVTKRFGDHTVLDKVNLEISEGQVTTIIGKSGAGKSVLLKHIIGLLRPDEGTILFQGKDIDKMKKGEWNAYVSQISYMFQHNALFDSLTVFENVALPLQETTNMHKREIRQRVMERIEQAELTSVADKYPAQLSGGMQKRVALSRALVTGPKIVLFDEPTTGQDPVRRNAILGMISEYQRKYGFTAVLISHDIPDVFFISNRLLVLDGGKIVFQGTPEALDDFEHPYVDEFIQSLEGLQEHLTGLYSRRNFRVRYQKTLKRDGFNDRFAVAVFSLDDWERIEGNVGHVAAQKVVKALSKYINEHFGVVGGFSSRLFSNQFVTVLPFSDLKEARSILDAFVRDLKTQGLTDIRSDARLLEKECFEFAISAGLAEGTSDDDVNTVIDTAHSEGTTIAQFRCESREVTVNEKVYP